MPRLLALAGLFALVLLAAGACGGSKRAVEVRWESPAMSATLSAEDASSQNSPLDTVVYVSNPTGKVLHSAVLRLAEDESASRLGLGIGTVTNAKTQFDGDTPTWSRGDLKPGDAGSFPIGLWFSSRHLVSTKQSLALAVELVSPDLPAPRQSNTLTLELTPTP